MKKIITIILAVVGVISIILLGRVINTGDTAIQSAAKAGEMGMVDSLFNPLAVVAYIVLAVIVLLVIVFMLKGMFSNPANLKRTLMSIGAFALIFALCYFVFADGVETLMPDDKILSAGDSKLVGAGIYMFYALAIIAGGAMLFTGVKKMIK